MKRFLWTFTLCFWLIRLHGCSCRRPLDLWTFANDECWQSYREDGYSAREAVLEDASYA